MLTVESAPPDAAAPPQVSDRLLARLERNPDFHAVKQSLRRVQSLLNNETSRMQCVATAIGDDVGLTGKLLRLINAAYYKSAGGGSITSAQRAVAVMGFDSVRNLSVSLRLMEQVPEGPPGLLLKEDFLRALLAARFARELCSDFKLLEEAGVLALFKNFGRMLIAAHLPDDALVIRRKVPRIVPEIGQKENTAARQRLGSSFIELGARVSRQWGWPDSLSSAMRVEEHPGRCGAQAADRVRWLAWLSNELADLLLYCAPQDWEAHCEALLHLAGEGSPCTARQAHSALANVRMDLSTIAEVLGIPVSQIQQREETDLVEGQPAAAAAGADALPSALATPAAAGAASEAGSSTATGEVDVQMLTEELMQITEAALLPNAREVVPQRTLAALFAGLGARRAVLFMRQRGPELLPVNVVGEALSPAPRPWRVLPGKGGDLFSKLCMRGDDTLISDSLRPQIRAHLPKEFDSAGQPNCFLVMPMMLQGAPIGMIYLDREDGEVFQLNEDNLRLLRMLRNQALAVLR